MNVSTATTDDRLLRQVESQPLGTLHFFVLTLCAVGFAFDLAELGLGNVLSAIFSAPPYATTPTQLSWLLAAPYVGGIVGAPAYGWLADRWGRRSTLIVMMITLGVFSVLGSQAEHLETLTIYRALSGLTLGAFPPVIIAYLTDLLPAKGRGRVLMITFAAAILSVPLSIFFIRWLTPIKPFGLDAWRCAFILYGAGSILTGLAMLRAPESVRWLVKAGRVDEAATVLLRFGKRTAESISDATNDSARQNQMLPLQGRIDLKIGHIGVFVLFSFAAAWASVCFPLLSGAILVAKGIKVPDALLYVGIAAFGPFITMFASSFVIDRVGRRPALWGTSALMAVMSAMFVMGEVPWLLVASGLLFQVANSIFVPTMSMYLAEMFPTERRGLATSSLWAVNRLGSVVAPLVMLPLLRASGPFPLFLITAGALLFCIALLATMPRGQAGRPVI